jgi:hypothetical protein
MVGAHVAEKKIIAHKVRQHNRMNNSGMDSQP